MAIGTLMPLMIYMYYLFVEAWCLAYAWDYLTGHFGRLGGLGHPLSDNAGLQAIGKRRDFAVGLVLLVGLGTDLAIKAAVIFIVVH